LLISALFVILAARIQPEAFRQLGWGALGVFLAIQFLGRPLKVAYATWGSRLSFGERALVAWIGPRGIVAAAIAALLALRLEEAGVPKAELMVPLVFSIIIATVLVQGAVARPLARRLGVAEPEPNGLLIVGANRLARAIAAALDGQGFQTLLADSSRRHVSAARMQGLSVFYGNPVSAHADRHLDLVGLGRLLGLSPDPDLNALAALRFRGEFGAGEIYHLRSTLDTKGERRRAVALEQRGRCLFGADHSYAELDRMLAEGAEIRATQLSEEFAFEDFHRHYWKRAVPLFGIDPRGRLRIFTAQDPLEPKPGWTILALVLPEKEPKKVEKPAGETA
jgi:CPA1 family monovalent cation:H+ antiporter